MVLYEFECEQCGRVEKRCRLSTVETACPRCGKIIRRAFSFDV
ncbi:MAG: FmdB family zinc ribbon protein, partial [Candidatus Micrarchaeota archaeon]